MYTPRRILLQAQGPEMGACSPRASVLVLEGDQYPKDEGIGKGRQAGQGQSNRKGGVAYEGCSGLSGRPTLPSVRPYLLWACPVASEL